MVEQSVEWDGGGSVGFSAILLSIIVGIGSNLDIIGIGFAYGVQRIRISVSFCILTAVTSFCACLIGGLTGHHLEQVVPTWLSRVLGTSILVTIGVWIVFRWLIERKKSTDPMDPRAIGFSEMMFIGLAQALSDLSIGFGIGLSKVNVLLTALSVGVFSFLFLVVPCRISSQWLANKFGNP